MIQWQSLLPTSIVEKLERKENIVKILANAFWLISDRLIRISVSLIVGVWVARYLNPDNYGKLNNALAYVTLFASFATLGFDSILIRDLVKKQDEKNSLLGSAFLLRLISGSVVYCLSACYFIFFKQGAGDQQTRWMVYIISAGIVFQSFDIIDLFFQSQIKSKFTVFAKNAAFLAVSILRVVLILSNASLTAIATTWLLEMIFNAIGLVFVFHKQGYSIFSWTKNWPTIRYLLTEGFGFYIAYISGFLYMKIDQIMIGEMLDNHKAGLFAASTKLYEIPFTILLIISSSVFPSLVNIYNTNIDLFYKRFAQVTSFVTFGGGVVVVSTWFAGKWAIVTLFGIDYADAVDILNIQIAGLYFLCLGALRSSFLSIVSGQKILVFSTVFSAIFNLVSNFYLIPTMGPKGAAWATVVTQLLSLVLLNFFFIKTRRLFYIQIQSAFLVPIIKKLLFLSKKHEIN